LAKAFDARERASQAQEAAMGALTLPSAADLERLTRRVRSVSQRLEGIEDGVDRLDERLAALPATGLDERLTRIEEALDKLVREVEAMRKKLPATPPRRAAAAKKPA
jgi:predicted  nucleic acid-binding Zn-ribbon protein